MLMGIGTLDLDLSLGEWIEYREKIWVVLRNSDLYDIDDDNPIRFMYSGEDSIDYTVLDGVAEELDTMGIKYDLCLDVYRLDKALGYRRGAHS